MSASEIDLDFARPERIGLEEAIYCAGKSPAQIDAILDQAHARNARLLLTRLDPDKLAGLAPARAGEIDYCDVSRTGFFGPLRLAEGPPQVAVVCAGTSDTPVAREAERVLRYQGRPSSLYLDVGVAGLHRLISRLEAIRAHPVVIVCAGMDAALPSVLGGLVASPLIAVPTSVGYGVAEGGRTALNSMLASCAPGISVVNIDNGYGAACAALRILHAAERIAASRLSAPGRLGRPFPTKGVATMPGELRFTVDQAIGAQRALRHALGLGPETFRLPAFIGMISDEIQQMREAGRSDSEIVAIISETTGATVAVGDLARFYASPEQRQRPE